MTKQQKKKLKKQIKKKNNVNNNPRHEQEDLPKKEEDKFIYDRPMRTEISGGDEDEEDFNQQYNQMDSKKDDEIPNIFTEPPEMPRSYSVPNLCYNPDDDSYQHEITRDFRSEIQNYFFLQKEYVKKQNAKYN